MVETVISQKLDESITRPPQETQILNQELQTLREDMKRGFEEIQSRPRGVDETVVQKLTQLESMGSHLTSEQQRIAQEAHLLNDRWSKAVQGTQEKIEALETIASSHKQRSVNLEAIKTKQEMSTPDSGISKRLFGQGSSGSHSQNEETSIQELKHDVERLTLWVQRITGKDNLNSNPMSFPKCQT